MKELEFTHYNPSTDDRNELISIRCTFEEKVEFNEIRNKFLKVLGRRFNNIEMVMHSLNLALNELKKEKESSQV